MRALALILALLLAGAASADRAFPGEEYVIAARFPAGAGSVTADVVDLGSGVQVANDLATTRAQADGANTDVFSFDLASMPGYPVNCEPVTYLVRWTPDGQDCSSATGNPSLCVEDLVRVGGGSCKADPRTQVSYVFASDTVSAQGISQSVLDWHARRGRLPIRWREIRVARDMDFASPDEVLWEVYFYTSAAAWPHLTCTVVTETDPNVALPSSAACVGN